MPGTHEKRVPDGTLFSCDFYVTLAGYGLVYEGVFL